MVSCTSGATSPDPQFPGVIVPDTSKVADADTRAALTTYESQSNVLKFSKSTPMLANLKPGDVVR